MTVSVSLPAARAPAATGMEALPLLNVAAVEVYVPLVKITEPVAAPLTVTVTVNDCAVVMLEAEGVTDTVGVTFAGGVVVVEPPPPPQALRAKLMEAANRSAAVLANRFISISPVRSNRPVTARLQDFRVRH